MSGSILCVLFLFAPFLLVLVWYYQYFKFEKYLKRFPGPKPTPVIGNALDFQNTAKLLPALVKYREKYQGNFKIYIGFEPVLIVSEQKAFEFILTSTRLLTKSKPYRFLRNWLGTGILTSTNDKWKKHRKLITPAFHFQILEEYLEVFNSASNTLIEKMSKEVGKASVDVYPYITACALDIICESAMGTSVNAQENGDCDYVRSVKAMCRIVVDRAFSPLQQYDFFYHFSDNYRVEKASLKLLHGYTESVIRRKKSDFSDALGQRKSSIGVKKKLAFLDLLLSYSVKEDTLTDEELREEVDTLMFEGHDTTASSMSFVLYCLSKNPHVQRKVFDEIKSIFAEDRNRTATHHDLQEMKYMDLVIKETLRLYPSVPFYGREIVEDTEYDGKTLPKGLSVILLPYGIQRDPAIYPDPDKFDPDRFLVENMQGKSPFTYLPFSAGPRNCIGQKFAVLEMKATVSKILRHFEILPAVPEHHVDLVAESVLKSKNGIFVQLRKRCWDF